jgi:hypothetical protein
MRPFRELLKDAPSLGIMDKQEEVALTILHNSQERSQLQTTPSSAK